MARKSNCMTYGEEATVQELIQQGRSSWRLCSRMYKTLCGRLDADAEFPQGEEAAQRSTGVCRECWAAHRQNLAEMDRVSEAERESLRYTTSDTE